MPKGGSRGGSCKRGSLVGVFAQSEKVRKPSVSKFDKRQKYAL
jgi:hypothetical protein